MAGGFAAFAAHVTDTTPAPNEADRVLSYLTLRVSVGVVGIALPIVLFVSHFFFGSHHLPGSISAFYYTPMRNYFVGTLAALGVFLFSYRYAKGDNNLSRLASGLIIFVALSPTAREGASRNGWNTAHLVTAALFFAILAYFSYFLFTLSDGSIQPKSRKALRNQIYRVCGITIAAALLAAAVLNSLDLLFWWESIAVLAFSFSWLVKGGVLFKDST
jgi:hypothetical protein